MRVHCPFWVVDPLFNSALAVAGEDLALIADALGEDPAPFRAQAQRTTAGLNARLWDGRLRRYLAYDARRKRPLPAPVAACFVPVLTAPVLARAGVGERQLAAHSGPGAPWTDSGGPAPARGHLGPGRRPRLLGVLRPRDRRGAWVRAILLDSRAGARSAGAASRGVTRLAQSGIISRGCVCGLRVSAGRRVFGALAPGARRGEVRCCGTSFTRRPRAPRRGQKPCRHGPFGA